MIYCALISMVFATTLGPAPKADFHLVKSDGMKVVGFYYPQRLGLSETTPVNFKSLPAVGAGSLYGTLQFGGKGLPVVVECDSGEPKSLLVDTTGTGDFTNAKSFAFAAQGKAPNQVYFGSAELPSPIAGDGGLSVKFYRFQTGTPRGDQLKTTLLYYSDYAMEGTITLGGTKYRAALDNATCTGEFTVPNGPVNTKAPPQVALLIDRNGDGRFSGPSEVFNAASPFNIGGTTYELHNGRAAMAFNLAKSSQTVAEVMPPPNTAVGQKVLAFTTKDRDGKTVNFPADFKGKVVMLDFWATWCGPCMGEVPNVVKQYNAFHDKGFDILGVSLDNKDTIKNITKVTGDQGMTWDQIADGNYWDAEIAKRYGIQAIPAAFIVDGDTGVILAEGDAIRGDNLGPAIQKALASRKGAPK